MMKINLISLNVVKEKKIEYQASIDCTADATEVFKKLIGGRDRECMAVITLNNQNTLNSVEIVSIGTLKGMNICIREMFKAAILQNAQSIMICHNHPSGTLEPSDEDIYFTRKVREAGELLGINLIDHILLADGRSKSLMGYL